VSESPRRRRVRVGELLLEQKLINEQQLKTALAEQARSGRRLGRVLTDLGMVSEQAFHEALAKHLQIPFMDLRQMKLAPEVVRLLPEALARRSRALVLKADAAGAMVAMADPTDLFAYDELAAALKRPIRLALVKETDLLKTMDAVYRRTDEIASIAQEVGEELRETDVDIERLAAEEGSPDAPIIRLIQTVFHDAMQVGASDVHIEPGDSALRVRQRVDGHLQEQVIEGGRRVASALTTRLKLLSGLDIAEKRLPQDGRFSVKIGGKAIDVRLSTMPTQHGESVVMRLLDQSSSLMSLETLGMPPPMLERFRKLIGRSAGMVLVTGPTGSGKTTTLYSALQHLNQADTKIITVEDPVEYRLDRINQVQVNSKIGLDFARVLRTTLRQDPDVILVGEMRDRETVEIGLRAAITGHMVFSTLHTMSAVATVHRLLDMGAPGYMIAAAVHGIVAQRLVRRVCENCARPVQADAHEAALLRAQFGAEAAAASFRAGSGCTYCNLSGYRGRIAVYELLEIDRTLTDAIRRGDLGRLEEAARASGGFVSLARSALDLAVQGITSVSEALGLATGSDSDEDTPSTRGAADPLLEEVLQADAARGSR
jgi:MSHA biogenesis protein MshE